MSNASNQPASIIHRANDRGHKNHGWLETWHSFSFAGWYDPARVHFGALRVLNDDILAPGQGFGRHPHDNMEIVTLVTEGALKHTDSMGNEGIIQAGEVQVMSAGTGVYHSEFNPDPAQRAKLFQIWLFPRAQGTAPRYDQKKLDATQHHNQFHAIIAPGPNASGLWIGQDAWFNLGTFDPGRPGHYAIKRPGNGVYALVMNGSAIINGMHLGERDAAGWGEATELAVQAGTTGAELLLIDLPMTFSN